MELTEAEWQRYSRQLMLPQITGAGQMRLKKSRMVILGLGSAAEQAARYLVGAGLGYLTLVDASEHPKNDRAESPTPWPIWTESLARLNDHCHVTLMGHAKWLASHPRDDGPHEGNNPAPPNLFIDASDDTHPLPGNYPLCWVIRGDDQHVWWFRDRSGEMPYAPGIEDALTALTRWQKENRSLDGEMHHGNRIQWQPVLAGLAGTAVAGSVLATLFQLPPNRTHGGDQESGNHKVPTISEPLWMYHQITLRFEKLTITRGEHAAGK